MGGLQQMRRTVWVMLTAMMTMSLTAAAGDADGGAAKKAGLPAFPGAEGFGAVSVGGRGGKIIKVTNLKASGPGSLQAACSAKGPRIVVFEVSGVIPVKGKALTIGDGNITIAGQTAPGAGITVAGPLSTKAFYNRRRKDPTAPRIHDLIIRFLRFRVTGRPDVVRLVAAKRFVLDHVSGAWGTDENFDFSVSQSYTIQWCGIDESAWTGPLSKYRIGKSPQFKAGGNSTHNYGMIMGYTEKGNVSLHHNLFTHHNRRTPLCGVEILDHRNNVIYNVAAGILFHGGKKNKDRPGKPFRSNIIGNYFKCGPSVPFAFKDGLPGNRAGKWRTFMVGEAGTEAYAEGNYFAMPGKDAPGKVIDVWSDKMRGASMRKCIKAEKPWPAPPVVTQKAEEAYESVLAHSGCLPRDAVSKRMVKDTREGTGEWGRHDPKGGLMAGLTPGKAPRDSDNDGMSDEWEKAHKLNPADPKDANKIVPAGASKDDRHKGYTYIEYYINELADNLIEKAKAEAAAAAKKRKK